MKRILSVVLGIVLLIWILAPTMAIASSTTTIKLNLVKTSSDPEYAWWEEFLKEMEEKSNGTLKLEIYPSESLGKTVDMLEAASKGAKVMQDCDASWLANYVPDFAMFMAPYLIQKPEQIEQVWKSEIGQDLSKRLEEKGLRLVTYVYFGTRNLITSKPVHSRADTANLKIRCAATPMWNEVVRVLGGHPTNTAWSEAYQAVSQGVADGAESPFGLLYSSKLFEPAKYIAETQHLVAATAVVMSAKVYNELPEEAQKAIDEVGASYPPKHMKNMQSLEEKAKELLIAEGVTISTVDKTPFIEAAQETPNKFPEWTPGLYEKIREYLDSND